MEGFLDPRSDLVFRRIFGEHPDILRNFLNAMLPLEAPIESLEYLPADVMPVLPVFKRGIVDVRCQDVNGRQFIVEMQMQWTTAFLQRVVFNASQAYVKQLERGEAFELLQPVYALSLLDDVYIRDSAEYYHHYQIVNITHPQHRIDGLEFVFVELPKFKETNPVEARRVRWAWLKFLREAGDAGREGWPGVAEFERETAVNKELAEALQLARESKFTPRERDAYDRFWDAVRTERTLIEGKTAEALARGIAEGAARGMAEGLAKGIEQGLAKGIKEGLAKGIEEGKAKGIEEGIAKGIEEGKAKGIEEGKAKGIEEGKAKGIEEGIAKGIEEGRAEALARALERMVLAGIPEEQARKILAQG
jgi:predicted transposase/invertase (TIGR01784 family)